MKHVARKRFGQNFLIDNGIVAAIISAIAPSPEDRLVEIGPGLGALTTPLLACVRQLHVVEIDRDIVARLRARADAARLQIHEGDALAFDFATLGSDLRIVGNLPYNISTPLLFHLAACARQVRDMHFMLQKEVVERMVAEPGGREYGRLSVMLQYRFALEWLLDVPPESFDPAPKVDSAVVRLIPYPESMLTAVDEAVLAALVARAFAQRRKMLRNTLRSVLNDEDYAALNLAPTVRAEDVPVAVYVQAANRLAARGWRGTATDVG